VLSEKLVAHKVPISKSIKTPSTFRCERLLTLKFNGNAEKQHFYKKLT